MAIPGAGGPRDPNARRPVPQGHGRASGEPRGSGQQGPAIRAGGHRLRSAAPAPSTGPPWQAPAATLPHPARSGQVHGQGASAPLLPLARRRQARRKLRMQGSSRRQGARPRGRAGPQAAGRRGRPIKPARIPAARLPQERTAERSLRPLPARAGIRRADLLKARISAASRPPFSAGCRPRRGRGRRTEPPRARSSPRPRRPAGPTGPTGV